MSDFSWDIILALLKGQGVWG